nr:glyoxylate/hydroxypyruvate reductase HPR3-like [Tanacetum cinerariifolium]
MNNISLPKAYESSLPTHDFLHTYAQSVKVVICSIGSPITAEVLADLPSLELVVTSTTGVNHIDMAECRRRGIRVTNTGDLFSDDVADGAVGLLIDVMRRISSGDRFVRGGLWPMTEVYTLGSKGLTNSLDTRDYLKIRTIFHSGHPGRSYLYILVTYLSGCGML